MATLETRRWEGDLAGLTRRDRRPCNYEVYLPDPLAGRNFSLDGDVAADVSEAEAALVRLNTSGSALAGAEALARLLLRAESVASSRIEGLVIGGRRLLRADAARQMGEYPSDVTAAEVLGNIDAMVWGVEAVGPGGQITVEILLEAHRRLLAGTSLEEHGGRIRSVQNWIGGSSYNPCSAAFVPPPPEAVAALMDDLCAFCNEDSLPALGQAAVAHAQFETIHPFVDGNGRAGRALMHLVLRRRGLGLRVLPPISLVLASRSLDYVNGLTATRYLGAPDSAAAHAGINRWIAFFASACRRAVEYAKPIRGAGARAAIVLARARRNHPSRFRSPPAHWGATRCAGINGIYRGGIDRPIVPGDEPGDRSACGRWSAFAGQRRPAQSRL